MFLERNCSENGAVLIYLASFEADLRKQNGNPDLQIVTLNFIFAPFSAHF